MSKRTLEEVEDDATLSRKKSKKAKKDKAAPVEESEVPVAPTEDAMDVDSEAKVDKKEKKEKKKSKKEKKEKTQSSSEPTGAEEENTESKPKKSKKDKKEKKRKAEDDDAAAEAESTPSGDAAVSNEASAVEEEEVKPKKEKKDKKSKKSKAQDAEVATNGAATNGHDTNGADSNYVQNASLSALPESEIESFLKANETNITDPLAEPGKALRPITEFSHLPKTTLTSKNPFKAFKSPTPIQSASWPFGLSGRDIVGVAETGSGKTIAFGLPLVEAVLKMPKPGKTEGRIRAVVVSPTRELAMQTAEQLEKLGEVVGLSTVCVYGGASKDTQRNLLRKADIIVATPGRLKDFLEEGSISLGSAKFAVLDEADRMLDKGFEDDIKLILGQCPAKESRQTLMFTATWPQSVQALASTFMKSPVKIQIGGNTAGDLQANSRIEQRVEVVDPRGKEQRVLQILKQQPKNERVIVFCLYKKEATRVEQFLQQRGIKVVGIHGDLRQEQRTRSLDAFKKGDMNVMVATDVAARGLDIPEVKLVLNVTFPLTIEDYVHRIGRTGRAGKTGLAITMFTEHDKAHSGELVNILKQANQPVPEELMKFGTTVKKKQHGTYGAFFKDVDMSKKPTKITFD
ncbi:ATP-dependent RNA helicase DBP3 [Apiospora phragmitis]|uniref:RNA helicase n=1 Tax=Apiospora phragmitis TaxID=2905665 RepID=A0ABR1VZB1_9PEZI